MLAGAGVTVVAAAIPEVLEVHTITGAGDMLCRVVARTNADLQRVIDAIVEVPGVVRTATVIVLAAPVKYRVLPLVHAAAAGCTVEHDQCREGAVSFRAGDVHGELAAVLGGVIDIFFESYGVRNR